MRDINGKEIAVYSGTTLQQWNLWGLDQIGHMNVDTSKYFYLKDHLGSTRAVINTRNQVVSAQDYDCWGYLLENRTYQSNNTKYKFTGKEHDNENNYDYFGARYYDSRIANWTSVDPLFEKHIQWTPYNYVLRSPIRYIDPKGEQVETALGLAAAAAGAVVVTYAIYQTTTIIINSIKEGNLGSYSNPYILPATIGVVGLRSVDYIKMAINLAYPWQNAQESQPDKSESKQEKPDYPVPELDETGKPKGDEWIPPKTPQGNWTKPKPSKEYLRPDPKHKPPIGPHTDWKDPSGKKWRIYPDNKVLPKKN